MDAALRNAKLSASGLMEQAMGPLFTPETGQSFGCRKRTFTHAISRSTPQYSTQYTDAADRRDSA